ncbi:hypothetical protein CCHR01_02262 [Colletotrichum chrysophilum]|uniref:Uncharacterized protein n=1 Tax=Colletotrichum chrysophilum TaxID=1836956 RepID=A0AAD9ESJ3_9PEZI|nr:hypothetical protein CCHR01_02262 [Colletotrichum chrysophilum]
MEGKLADVVPPCRDYGSEEPKSDMHRAAPHSPEGRGILRRSYIVTISGPRGLFGGSGSGCQIQMRLGQGSLCVHLTDVSLCVRLRLRLRLRLCPFAHRVTLCVLRQVSTAYHGHGRLRLAQHGWILSCRPVFFFPLEENPSFAFCFESNSLPLHLCCGGRSNRMGSCLAVKRLVFVCVYGWHMLHTR